MPYAVELFFDPDADARVRQIWSTLSQAGICDYLTGSPSRPHVSLSVFDHDDEFALIEFVRSWAAPRTRFAIELSGPSRFPQTTIVFLSPQASGTLQPMQRDLHAALVAEGARVWPQYEPGRWIPHCTIAMHAALECDAAIKELVDLNSAPLRATVLRVGLVRFSPVVHLANFSFREITL